MTKQKSLKRALISSVLALALCFTMLIGTTYAWFTDSVTSANNVIKSGTLEIEFTWAKGNEDPTAASTVWTDASKGPIFNNQLWEPGYTESRHFKLKNVGTLALKYQFAIVPNGEVSELADVIDVYLYDGTATQVANRTDLDASKKIGTLADLINNGIKQGNLEAKAEYNATIVLKMQESAGNEYQNLSIGSDFAIRVLATQYTAENDSFNNKYDEDAWHPDFTVTSLEDLAAALANGGKIQVNGTLNAGATQDVPNWTNAPAEFIFDATTLDALKGGKYVLEQGSRYGVVGLISAGESLALSDMEITANSQWPVYLSNYGGTLTLEDIDVTATQGAGIYPYGTNGTTTIKSATVNQKALSDEFASSTPWAGTAIATSDGHNLIIEDGIYIGSTWGVYVYNSGANVTINGGTFKAPKVIQADGVWSGGNKSVVTVNDGNFDGALYLDWGTTPPEIYINGGNFTNFSATVNGAAKLVIKGGTFDTDPSAYVADGFKAVENNGTYYVVSDTVNNIVVTPADLATAIAQGGTVYVANDIDMNNAWTSVQPTAELTILGNGNRITNLNLPLLAGGVSTKVTFKSLTVADSNVAPAAFENGLGTGAFVPYVDAYGNVAFEDCHLVNSTVTGNKRAGGFVGYTSGQTLEFKDCTVDECVISAVGGAAGLVAYSQAETTIDSCSVTNTKVTATEDRLGTETALAGSVIGTVNADTIISKVTASGNTVSNNNALPAFSNEIGRKVAGTLTIDGKTVVLVQSAELPHLTLNSNATYMLTGDFGGQNVSLVMPVGVENVIFDGSKATNINELIITQNGALIDNANTPIGERSGNVTVQNFNVLSQINVFACKTEVVVQKNTAEALMIYAGNCDIKVLNNTIDANFESHPTYQNATQTWNTNNYGIALNIFDYNLWLDGNTVTDAIGHAIGINGWETTIDNGDENVIESFKNNTITVNSTSNTKRVAFKVWDDETYASNDDDTNVINATAQAFIDAVLADGSNTFNILDGYNHTIFSFYNVNTNN